MLSKAQIKYIHSLQHKKYRQRAGVFPIEGTKPVVEMLRGSHIRVVSIFAVPQWIDRYAAELTGSPVPTLNLVTDQELKHISWLDTPQQVLALCEIPSVEAPDPTGRLTLVLEAIRDPGNLGTIIRIADWFGLHTIVCSSDCVDPYNPKTIQATMGSIARVQVAELPLEDWLDRHASVPLLAATLDGEPVTALVRPGEAILAIGNESNGLSPTVLSRAARRISIPRLGGAESLNAAVAAAILVERLLL